MNSWVSGRSCEEPDPAALTGGSQESPDPHGETAAPAAGRVPQGPLLDGSSPLRIVLTGTPPIMRLAGDIDEWTYPDLTGGLAQVATAADGQIRIDLADVEYCDVAGLRAIISLATGGGNGRDSIEQLVLAHPPGSLRAVLRILGWDTTPGLVLEDGAC